MKKIIATVLAMVMALALCTTAFAANEEYYIKGVTQGAAVGKGTLTFVEAKDPTVNDDGDTTAPGNVAYYTTAGVQATSGDKFVVVSTLAEADFVVYSDEACKNVVMYLDKVIPEYYVATVFTNFGKNCGQLNYASYSSSKTYYVAEENGADVLYVGATEAHASLMVNGKLVGVDRVGATSAYKVNHVATPTVKDGKITGYTCSKCKAVAVEAPNYASIPTGVTPFAGNWYFPVAGSTTTDTTTTTSPKTFDAGIAMYVGMALTSVAGSAVVIGKKKEF